MKTILSSAVFFMCTITMAQDIAFISAISKTDKGNAREASDKIASLTTLSYRFYKAMEKVSDSTYTIIYAPASITDADLESKSEWDECLYVDFKLQNKNSMESKILKFQAVRGKYLDIFPTWKKYFKQKAHIEYTITDSTTRETIDTQRGYHFILKEGENARIPRWSIINKS